MAGTWAIEEQHRRMLAAESGAVVKDPGGRLGCVLLYPGPYRVGMANLGLAVVYGMINRRPDALCERAFAPDGELAAAYRTSGAPLLSLESSRPVSGFDLVLATLSFENDAPALAAMAEHAGLGMDAGSRRGPLLVLGGVAPMLNPEPYAGLADGFLLGEAEAVLDPFLDAVLETAGLPREERLLALAQRVEGFYAPRFYRPAYGPDGLLAAMEPLAEVPARVKAPKYEGPPEGLARSVFRAEGPEFGDMALIEAGRGCPRGCRFCAAAHVFRPPRLAEAGHIREAVLERAGQGGRLGLVAAAVSDVKGVGALAAEAVAAGGRVSVSSLRADRCDAVLAGALAASGHQTVALAPEAGSARLRKVINKHLSDQDLFRAVESLVGAGVPNLRLYFMVGLPTETEAEVDELAALAAEVRQQVVSLSREKGRLGRVTLSLNAFVPKPWTPFQWEPMLPQKEIKARMDRVQGKLKGLSNLKVTCEVPKYALLQGVLARGDRRLAPLLAALAGGAKPGPAYRQIGVDPAFYACRRRERSELLPWSVVDHGLSSDYLWSEAGRALEARQSPPCIPSACGRCGVCPKLGEER